MKKLFYAIFFVSIFTTATTAQIDIEQFSIGANLSYAKPVGDFSKYAKGGFAYTVNAGYKFTDNFTAGLEYGSAFTASLADSLNTGFFGIDIFGLQSILAKGWYVFSDGTAKPYVGAGIGAAQVAEPDITIGNSTIKGAKQWGLGANIELGVILGSFNISYSFNLGGKGPKESIINSNIKDLSVNYHRFSLGYYYNF